MYRREEAANPHIEHPTLQNSKIFCGPFLPAWIRIQFGSCSETVSYTTLFPHICSFPCSNLMTTFPLASSSFGYSMEGNPFIAPLRENIS
jgi:hypothetical protein